MNSFKTVMQLLHSSNVNEVIKSINQSKYIDDLPNLKDDFIIHTGFTFRIYPNKLFELFYDIETNLLIRQIKNDHLNLPILLEQNINLKKSLPENI